MTQSIVTHTILDQLKISAKLRGKSTEDKLLYYSVPVTESGCHIWIGAVNAGGYGILHHNGKPRLAHRVSYEQHHGELSDKCALHKCDVRSCINPDHLFSGTNLDNVNDKVSKGRAIGLCGEENPNSKLTNENIKYIRASSLKNGELSEMFNVSITQISRVRNNHFWRNQL